MNMPQPFKVVIVDDDPLVLDVLQSILEPDNVVTCFDSVEACEAYLYGETPDFLLLDISLPGVDGYDLCQLIKKNKALSSIPVTFISSHDSIEARLKGYDSGGDDFIIKPFAPDEVLRKVKVAKTLRESRKTLQEKIEAAEYRSSLTLANMDESGLILQFVRKLISWDKEEDIVIGLLDLLQRYHLDGVVQARISQRTITHGTSGRNVPLESSIVDHVRTLGRLFEFRTRTAHNFDHLTMMVNNMPVENPDVCGWLRENLSIAAESADARLKAIEAEHAAVQLRPTTLDTLKRLSESIESILDAQDVDRKRASDVIQSLRDELTKSLVMLRLTEEQEALMETLVRSHLKRLSDILDWNKGSKDALREIQSRLKTLH